MTAQYDLPKEGPWNNDPTLPQEWIDERTGYLCRVRRNSLGCLLGYIAVTKEHPWFGLESDEIDADVHGGVTYAQEKIDPQHPNDPQWWVGFDCAHSDDFAPLAQFPSYWNAPPSVYRDFVYVKAEVERLAIQAWNASLIK